MRGMVIEMNDEQLRTVADLQGFLDGTVAMDFTVVEDERYAFIARAVKRFGYPSCSTAMRPCSRRTAAGRIPARFW